MHALRSILFAFCACAAASASVVDRSQVTLGVLSDAAHGVAQVTVRATEPDRVQLHVDDALKGHLGTELWLPRGEARLSWSVGERWLVFLSHDGQAWRPLSSGWQRIAQGGAAYALAVRSRLPRLGGAAGALQADLFAQLQAPEPRIAADAALDLLSFRKLDPSASDLAELQLALDRQGSPELFRLCARLGNPSLASSVLRAARRVSTGDAALRPAAEALVAVDGQNAIGTLAGDLAGSDAEALRAVRLLGDMGQGAHAHLNTGLQDPRVDVRAASIRALARSETPLAQAQASALLVLARQGAAEEHRLALAALARVGPAALLKAAAREHTDLGMRALAEALRRDPSELARRILGE